MRPGATPATVLDIDLPAFVHNIQAVRSRLAPTCQMMAVVKADAYGHGAIPLAMTARRHGVDWLGVARCSEGVALRQAGIHGPILVLGPTWPEDIAALVAHRLTPVLGSLEEATAVQQEAGRYGRPYAIHLKIDTGMGRFGFLPAQFLALLDGLRHCAPLVCDGLMTHLACADTPDRQSAQAQLTQFRTVLQYCAQRGFTPRYVHAANSAAIYRYPESHWNLVRAGIALYGAHPFEAPEAAPLRPIMRWIAHLVRIQELPAGYGIGYGHTFTTRRASRIGTLPVGYADGFARSLSNRAEVLVHGQRVPVVGQICMDMCMIDVTDVPEARVGDAVVLLGTQGQGQVSATELAAWSGRIPYEVFCAIGHRVPRHYVDLEATPCL
ncbi:MAG: alanine racemase [Candidatus Tectimicrobiota bacterium]